MNRNGLSSVKKSFKKWDSERALKTFKEILYEKDK